MPGLHLSANCYPGKIRLAVFAPTQSFHPGSGEQTDDCCNALEEALRDEGVILPAFSGAD